MAKKQRTTVKGAKKKTSTSKAKPKAKAKAKASRAKKATTKGLTKQQKTNIAKRDSVKSAAKRGYKVTSVTKRAGTTSRVNVKFTNKAGKSYSRSFKR